MRYRPLVRNTRVRLARSSRKSGRSCQSETSVGMTHRLPCRRYSRDWARVVDALSRWSTEEEQRTKQDLRPRTNARGTSAHQRPQVVDPARTFTTHHPPLRPTLSALQQSISNTRILVSSSPCSLCLSAAKDDKTGLSNLRGAKCAIL